MLSGLLLAFIVGASEPLAVDEILSEYRAYELMTPDPVEIDMAVLEDCVIHRPDERYGPHGNGLVSVFMNAPAASAFRSVVATGYPQGSIIVKKKESPFGGMPGFGGMIKRSAGYDPGNGDWEYFTGTPKAGYRSGRLSECNDCHLRAQETDHVFGDWSAASPRP